MQPLVTIVVPVYNVEKYLDRCIKSLANQTYRNLEIILVDDGSPDNCPQMCDEWSKKDSRIRVIHKDNGGISSARNAGIDNANGDYLVFADSDDYMLDECIESMYAVANNYGVDIVIGGFQCVCDDGKVLNKIEDSKDVQILDSIDALSDMLLGRTISTSAWAKLYSRKLFSEIRFPVDRIYEDIGTVYKTILLSAKVAVLMKSTYCYLYRSDSVSHVEFNDKTMDMLYMTEEMLREVLSHYPQLINEAYYDLFAICMGLLRQMDFTKNNVHYEVIKKRVRYLKSKVLFLKTAQTKYRLFALISYLGVDILHFFIWYVFNPVRSFVKKC